MNIEEKLKVIKDLKKDWNGNGAEPFTDEHIRYVRYVLNQLPPYEVDVFPTADDSIQLDYVKPDETYLEFEIYKNKVIKMFNGTKNVSIEVRIPEMITMLKHFFQDKA